MPYKMLIVDNIELNRVILKGVFIDQFEVLEADSGEEALEIIKKNYEAGDPINIVLLDFMMPKLNGVDVLDMRKDIPYFKSIPVVVITGQDDHQDQILSFRHGANDYITKPFVRKTVRMRVNNAFYSDLRIKEITAQKNAFLNATEIDDMTGMYNKTTAKTAVEKALKEKHDQLHAMMMLDVDNFKLVNEIEGRLVGDHTLKIVADLILSHFRKDDIVGRVDGDRFMVFMNGIPDRSVAIGKAGELVRLFKYKPNLTVPANVSLSIGLTFDDKDAKGYTKLFRQASEALMRSKQNGKGRYTVYDEQDVNPLENQAHVVLLASRNRDVCNALYSFVDDSFFVVEAGTAADFETVLKKTADKVEYVFFDTSDGNDNGKSVWADWKRLADDKHKNIKIIAICDEGNVEQYSLALSGGASDIITTPIDVEAAKRKMERLTRHPHL